ncbi:MAG TPA: hypothetical protein VEZ46_09620 [Mycobacteriales bacterium]|nr:hypothetical protein [Mycobacteriales bacterium]
MPPQANTHDGKTSCFLPAASMVWLAIIQSPGPPADTCRFFPGPSTAPAAGRSIRRPQKFSAVSVTTSRTGVMRRARTIVGISTCMATTTASVTGRAVTVRRTTCPAAVPSVSAKTVYATGTVPRAPNVTAERRLNVNGPVVSRAAPIALSIGLDHQVTARLSEMVGDQAAAAGL